MVHSIHFVQKLCQFELHVQGFQYFSRVQALNIYRRYFKLKFENFHECLKQHSLKSEGTKDHFKGTWYRSLLKSLHVCNPCVWMHVNTYR